MAKFEAHCEESMRLFGKPYPEVHRWLDAFAGSQEYGYRHRNKWHHDAGICQAIERFRAEAGPVARQHIITDLKDEGWTEADHFPRDERDYVQMGLF
jgi:hypothetical protein